MSAREKSKLKNICNEDIFSALDEHTKRIIAKDMEEIYEEKAHLLNPDDPWIFEMGKRQ